MGKPQAWTDDIFCSRKIGFNWTKNLTLYLDLVASSLHANYATVLRTQIVSGKI